jgi:hypothetical protein
MIRFPLWVATKKFSIFAILRKLTDCYIIPPAHLRHALMEAKAIGFPGDDTEREVRRISQTAAALSPEPP